MVYSQWQNRRVLTWSIDFEQKSRCVFRHQVAFFRQKRGETKQTKLLKQQFFCVSGPERVPPLFFVVAASFRWGYFIYEVFFWRELDTVASLKRLIIGGTSRSGKKNCPTSFWSARRRRRRRRCLEAAEVAAAGHAGNGRLEKRERERGRSGSWCRRWTSGAGERGR